MNFLQATLKRVGQIFSNHDQNIDYTKKLPDEVLLIIFNHLSYPELCSVNQVSKHWNRLSLDESLGLDIFRIFVKKFHKEIVPKKIPLHLLSQVGMPSFLRPGLSREEEYLGKFESNLEGNSKITIQRYSRKKEQDFSVRKYLKVKKLFFRYSSLVTTKDVQLEIKNPELSERQIRILEQGIQQINKSLSKIN